MNTAISASPVCATMLDPAGNSLRRSHCLHRPPSQWRRSRIACFVLISSLAALVTHDLLIRRNAQTRLQIEAIRMAVAGAAFLPGAPERAKLAADHSAEQFGLTRADVLDAGATRNGMSFNVSLRHTVPVLILRIFGAMGTTVGAEATATVHPYIGPPPMNRPDALPSKI